LGRALRRELKDIFEVQEEVTRSIVAAMAPEITKAEFDWAARKRPESITAYEIAVRAHARSPKAWFNTDYALCNQVIQEAQEALAIDRSSTLALNAFAIAQYELLTSGMAADGDAALRDRLAASAKVVEMDPSDGLGNA